MLGRTRFAQRLLVDCNDSWSASFAIDHQPDRSQFQEGTLIGHYGQPVEVDPAQEGEYVLVEHLGKARIDVSWIGQLAAIALVVDVEQRQSDLLQDRRLVVRLRGRTDFAQDLFKLACGGSGGA